MGKTIIKIATMQDYEIPNCLYCGGVPIVDVEIKKKPFESDRISCQEVTCPYCGLSAPLNVWEAICGGTVAPICGDVLQEEAHHG